MDQHGVQRFKERIQGIYAQHKEHIHSYFWKKRQAIRDSAPSVEQALEMIRNGEVQLRSDIHVIEENTSLLEAFAFTHIMNEVAVQKAELEAFRSLQQMRDDSIDFILFRAPMLSASDADHALSTFQAWNFISP